MVIRQYTVNVFSDPVASDAVIKPGAPVGLDGDGNVNVCSDTITNFYGVAEDAKLDGSGLTGRDSTTVYVGASAEEKFTQNRLPDEYDQTLASGKMSVLTGSSTMFYTDQYVTDSLDSADPGDDLYVTVDGKFDTSPSSDGLQDAVAILRKGPTNVPRGVPGTETGADIAVESEQSNNEFILVVLK